MSRKKTAFLFGVGLLTAILACAAVGRITAGSYVDNVEVDDYLTNTELKVGIMWLAYEYDEDDGYLYNEDIENINDLLLDDVIVVKATLNNAYERKVYLECVLSELKIEEVYVGDDLKEGDSIYYFEPVVLENGEYMYATDGYNLMEEGKEYILFLKQIKNTYYGDDEYVYAPVATLYAKYEVSDNMPDLLEEINLEEPDYFYNYSDVKDQEVLIYDEDTYDKFIELKSEVLDTYE